MAVILRNYNIVRVLDGDKVINCTVIKLCFDYALIKLKGTKYKVPYHMIDKVIGHELLLHAE
jgi:hypothetical protein